jgi:dephospho-CoA kinase
LGAALVDTDAIARRLTAPRGVALPAIAQAFGPELVSDQGGLDRDRMRALAFSDPSARRRLEAILHPLIGDTARAEATGAAQAGAAAVVFDVPLLAESIHWRGRVDRVLVVDCEEATQISRVMARNGWAEETVLRVIAQQASRPLRRSIADAVIFNDSLSRQALRDEVLSLWRHWRAA